MKNKIKKYIMNNDAAIIVEATFVFPIVVFILLFIIFMGNIYYEQARVTEVVYRYALKGAEYVADPKLVDAEDGVVAANTRGIDIDPYRYVVGLFTGGVGDVEKKLDTKLQREITKTASLLGGVSVEFKGTDNENKLTCDYRNGLLYSKFITQANYEIKFPFFWFGSGYWGLDMSARSEVVVNDNDEFIRNIDMIMDLLEGSKFAKKVQDIFDKINSFINKFTK